VKPYIIADRSACCQASVTAAERAPAR